MKTINIFRKALLLLVVSFVFLLPSVVFAYGESEVHPPLILPSIIDAYGSVCQQALSAPNGLVIVRFECNTSTFGFPPNNIFVVTPGTFVVPGQGTLWVPGGIFRGWWDGNTLWAPGDEPGWGTSVSGTITMTASWAWPATPTQEVECEWYAFMWDFFGEKENAADLIAERLSAHGGTPPTPTVLTWLPMCEQYMNAAVASHEQSVARGIDEEDSAMYVQLFRDAIERGESVYFATTHLCLYGYKVDSEALAGFENSVAELESEIEPRDNFSTQFVSVTAFRSSNEVHWRMTNIPSSSTHVDAVGMLANWEPLAFDSFYGFLSPRNHPSDTGWLRLHGRNWTVSAADVVSRNGGRICAGFFVIRN